MAASIFVKFHISFPPIIILADFRLKKMKSEEPTNKIVNLQKTSGTHLRPCQTSVMELFSEIS